MELSKPQLTLYSFVGNRKGAFVAESMVMNPERSYSLYEVTTYDFSKVGKLINAESSDNQKSSQESSQESTPNANQESSSTSGFDNFYIYSANATLKGNQIDFPTRVDVATLNPNTFIQNLYFSSGTLNLDSQELQGNSGIQIVGKQFVTSAQGFIFKFKDNSLELTGEVKSDFNLPKKSSSAKSLPKNKPITETATKTAMETATVTSPAPVKVATPEESNPEDKVEEDKPLGSK